MSEFDLLCLRDILELESTNVSHFTAGTADGGMRENLALNRSILKISKARIIRLDMDSVRQIS